LEYLQMHKNLSRMGAKCKHKIHLSFMYFLYTGPEIILHNILVPLSFDCIWHRSDVEFPTCGVMLALKSFEFWSISYFRFSD
jgi:hypothetical protein